MLSHSEPNKNYRYAQGPRINRIKQDILQSLSNVSGGVAVMIRSRDAQMFGILKEALGLGWDSGMVEMAD